MVNVPLGKKYGTPQSFGFVDLGSAEDVKRAISEVNGREIDGRILKVDLACEKKNK